uniref:Phospholipid/glycerol acyltransferase domain-containing protein n=1 Tax=Globisporangium ultimum (strain ATCC 200006 / CBS 805.95 / DAOM BR144) TaxID=431595 RepID=K3X176_GLOUD
MEQVYTGKTLFITGATGFLAKAVVEKLLRSAPQIEKIYVLIRPRKGVEPTVRLKKDIIDSQIFDRLRSERPHDFHEFITSKLHSVAGDVTLPGLGLNPLDAQLLQENVQIVIHSAATVQFNEPLEVAVEMNCVGAMNALRFVQSCKRVLCYVHVSTAYVNSNQRNVQLKEQLYPLDFNVEDAMNAVTKASPSELERLTVNLMGTYPNTYALTKSMAEHLIVKHAGPNLPLVLYRPTIIGAAWKDPVPGWVDQVAGVGAIFLAASMGVLTILPGNPRNIADVVPVDMAVNNLLTSVCAKITAMPVSVPLIVHCGTSDPRQNPLRWRVPWGVALDYFKKNPPARGLFPVKFQMIPSHQLFQTQWFLQYALPSSVYSTVANKFGDPKHMKQAAMLWTLTWRARSLVELFKPFTENEWIFLTDSMDVLEQFQTPEWWINADEIVWERYIFNFCVGLKKYVLKEGVIGVDNQAVEHTELALSTGRILEWDPDHHAISFPGLLSDVSWAYTSSRKPGYTKSGLLGRVMGLTGWKEGMNHEARHVPRQHVESVGGVRNSVLESEAVRAAIHAKADEKGAAIDDIEEEAFQILEKMVSRIDYRSVRKFGWILRKMLRNMYDKIHVDEGGITQIREILSQKKGSVVLVPTHRSYIDFLLMSYLFFAYNIPVPYIAAGEDFLNMGYLTKILRESGAYFIRRSFNDDPLYTAIFREYTQYLVSMGHTVEFFIEGSRSRSGKQLHPKFGILNTVTECFLSGRAENIHIVPVTIDYEKPLEVLLHQNEVLGGGKIKESAGALLKSAKVVRKKFGSIAVQFGQPIDMRNFVATRLQNDQAPDDSIVSTTALVQDLAYEITDSMISCATCTPSNLVATILLMYRHGMSRKDLIRQSDWLREEISKRGGRVLGTEGRLPSDNVNRALELLQELVMTRRKNFVEPAISNREQYPNMIGLGYYRNKIMHWFNREGVLACAYHALDAFNVKSPLEGVDPEAPRATSNGVELGELMDGALFLHSMLRMEFVRKDDSKDREQLEVAFQQMLARQVLQVRSSGKIAVAGGSQPIFSLLCNLVWPFVDSYWVAITSLFALRPGVALAPEDLLKRIQWLAETMYHEKLISFYESCSLETLQNAITTLENWRVIERFSTTNARGKSTPAKVRLLPQFEQENELELLALRVAKFRNLPHGAASPDSVHSFSRENQLIASLPTLSKI